MPEPSDNDLLFAASRRILTGGEPDPGGERPRTRHVIASDGKGHRGRSGQFREYFSESLAVDPDQVKETKALLASHGVAAEFDSGGRIKITGPNKIREISKALGMFNGAHGYCRMNEDGRPINTGRVAQDEQARRDALSVEYEAFARGEPVSEEAERRIHQAVRREERGERFI